MATLMHTFGLRFASVLDPLPEQVKNEEHYFVDKTALYSYIFFLVLLVLDFVPKNAQIWKNEPSSLVHTFDLAFVCLIASI